MRYVPALLLASFSLIWNPVACSANNDNAKLAGHLILRTDIKSQRCGSELPPCNAGERWLRVNGALNQGYDLAIYILDADQSTSALEFGIEYGSNLRIFSWESCAEAQVNVPSSQNIQWPASGSGNVLVFGKSTERSAHDRDLGTTILVGSFYVYAYSADLLRFTPCPREPEEKRDPWDNSVIVADGNLVESRLIFPDNYGDVAFGSYQGRDPCVEGLSVTGISAAGNLQGLFFKTVNWSVASTKPRQTGAIVYSVSGRVIRNLGNILLRYGENEIIWDGKDGNGSPVAQGEYYLLLQGDDGFRAVRSAVLLRGGSK